MLVALVFTAVFCLQRKYKLIAMSSGNRKRKRETEVKKWTEEEVRRVLTYMQAHRNIEKPTAQLYYKKMAEEIGIDANWNLLKCKVRYLKNSMQKADAWRNSTGAGVEDGDSVTTVKDNILKMCPHYEQLTDIFSAAREIEVIVMDSAAEFDPSFLNVSDVEEESLGLDQQPTDTSQEPSTSAAARTFGEKVQRRQQNTSIDKLATMEKERMHFREKQLTLETKKFEWVKEHEKQKLENDFKIRKLEIEQKKYEIK